MSNKINIYCPTPTPRHHFVFSLIFRDLLGISYSISNKQTDIHLNYSKDKEVSGLQCTPFGMLAETEIRNSVLNEIEFENWNESFCFFRTSNLAIEVPFDIFSAAFFLVSRYEEYIITETDAHNRFPATESVLFKNNVLDQPLVNQWALYLRDILLNKFPNLEFSERRFEFISTIDIDQAWKFKNKGLLRNLMGFVQDIKLRKWENFKDRWPVLLGLKDDPFYNFDWQHHVHVEYSTKVKYFILLGNRSEFDKNIRFSNLNFIALIKDLNKTDNYEVGIHPSYKSNFNENAVKQEVKRLKTIINKDIKLSRQHFLMHQMPKTFDILLENNIQEEHTMGYSTHLGFRAGIASPFNYFNLKNNEETTMKLVPFCAMDITPLHYRNETPNEAIETLSNLMLRVKAVNGLFVSLWHNESFSETERWKGWRKVYLSLLKNSQ